MSKPVPLAGPAKSAANPAPACTLVIFGAAGDLTKRLLMPALYNLAGGQFLDGATQIIGVDHGGGDDASLRKDLTKSMKTLSQSSGGEFHVDHFDDAAWGWVRERLHYLKGDFLSEKTYADLGKQISGNVVFYFAVAARFFAPIAEHLGEAGLLKQSEGAFRRIIVEKPFGSDLASAKALNETLLSVAQEDQIFRIDHFLGKETVQSIMAIRFGNAMFEPIWRREHLDHVQITVSETIGVEQRGGFYEGTGALRDMVPNHLFQLLCMTAMEPPNSFNAEAIRDEKAKLIAAIQPVAASDAVRGQYGAGIVDGKTVTPYLEAQDVAPDSRTETYVALKLSIENWRWAGVPFYLRTGKCMGARRTEIALQFKGAPYQLFRDTAVESLSPNILRLQTDPQKGMRMEFNTKRPGPTMEVAKVAATFRDDDFFEEKPTVGYETLLYDCICGDATLFQRADSIEGAWATVDPVLTAWGAKGAPAAYEAGSSGPADADGLLARDGRRWLPLADA